MPTSPPDLAQQLRAFVRKYLVLLPRAIVGQLLVWIRKLTKVVTSPLRKYGIGLQLLAPRPGDSVISAEWLTGQLRAKNIIADTIRVATAEPVGLDGNRGLAGAISRILVTYSPETPLEAPSSLVLKMSHDSFWRRWDLMNSGQYREGMFYSSEFAKHPSLAEVLPTVVYSFGSKWTGETGVLMLDVGKDPTRTAVGVNFVMGNQIWGMPKDLAISPLPDRIQTLRNMYAYQAKIHAAFWNDEALISGANSVLRNNPWFRGWQRTQWELAIDRGRRGWETTKAKSNLVDPESQIILDPEFVAFIDESYNHTSWERLQKHLRARTESGAPVVPFTFCHGDFHAANQFLVSAPDAEDPSFPYRFRLFDWSEWGPWSAPTDLAQTLVSDLPVAVYTQHAIPLLEHWYSCLVAARPEIAASFSLEQAKTLFVQGGLERWVWVFGVLGAFPNLPPAAVNYFYGQVWGWIKAARDNDWEGLKSKPDEEGVVDGVRKWISLKTVVCLM